MQLLLLPLMIHVSVELIDYLVIVRRYTLTNTNYYYYCLVLWTQQTVDEPVSFFLLLLILYWYEYVLPC